MQMCSTSFIPLSIRGWNWPKRLVSSRFLVGFWIQLSNIDDKKSFLHSRFQEGLMMYDMCGRLELFIVFFNLFFVMFCCFLNFIVLFLFFFFPFSSSMLKFSMHRIPCRFLFETHLHIEAIFCCCTFTCRLLNILVYNTDNKNDIKTFKKLKLNDLSKTQKFHLELSTIGVSNRNQFKLNKPCLKWNIIQESHYQIAHSQIAEFYHFNHFFKIRTSSDLNLKIATNKKQRKKADHQYIATKSCFLYLIECILGAIKFWYVLNMSMASHINIKIKLPTMRCGAW